MVFCDNIFAIYADILNLKESFFDNEQSHKR